MFRFFKIQLKGVIQTAFQQADDSLNLLQKH